MIKVKFFVGDDSDLGKLQGRIEDWLTEGQVTPINVNTSVHYDEGWHIIVIVYYQDVPLSNLVVPTMGLKFQRAD